MTTTVEKIEGFDSLGTDTSQLIDRGYNGAPTGTLLPTGGLFGGGAIELTNYQGFSTGSESGIIQPDTWHHIEFNIHISTTGSATVYVDGVLAIDSGEDYFYDGSMDGTTVVLLGGDYLNTISPGHIFDDMVIRSDDTAFPALLGEHRIHTLLPSADTAQADWTGTFADIDDPLGAFNDGDTSYISTTTLNNKSEFTVADLPVSPTTIHALQTTVVAKKTDTGTKGVTNYIKSGATRSDGLEFSAPNSAYRTKIDIHETNPNGAIPWTEATVNSLLVGVEITT